MKSTGVFRDEELLFSHMQQRDNDPDVDLFATSPKPSVSLCYDELFCNFIYTTFRLYLLRLFHFMVTQRLLTDGGIFILQVPSQSSVKPVVPTLFGDDEDDDLFSSAKPKAPPVLFVSQLVHVLGFLIFM